MGELEQMNSRYGLNLVTEPIALACEKLSSIDPSNLSSRRASGLSSLLKSKIVFIGFGATRMLTPKEIRLISLLSDLGCDIEFNVIFILHHIYRHFFNEGIGIRQLIDYFYVIKACDSLEESVKNRITHSLSQFGLDKFSRSIFWILRELFGMNTDNYFMVDCDEIGGTQVLNEILITGNMGYGDPNRKTKRFDRITHRYKRLANFIVNYPSEILLRHPFLAYQNVKMYFTDN